MGRIIGVRIQSVARLLSSLTTQGRLEKPKTLLSIQHMWLLARVRNGWDFKLTTHMLTCSSKDTKV